MNDIIKITGVDGKHETMTSIQIAEITGKQHSHVMRDIRNGIRPRGIRIQFWIGFIHRC